MSPSAVVRSQARLTLKGNYVAAVAAFLILLLPVYIIIGLTYILDMLLFSTIDDNVVMGVVRIVVATPLLIVVFVLFSPMLNGYIRLYYRAALTRKFCMSDLFYWFEGGRYAKTLQLNLSYMLRLFLPAILCFLPLIAFDIFCFSAVPDFIGTVLYQDFSFILTVLSSILLILYSLKYFVVMTLYAVDGDSQVGELFRASREIMKRQKRAASQLIFSFTPWLLLCLLILPALYVVPYMTMSLCIGKKWMTLKGN